MHKYVTRQNVLFAHRVQELSGAETSLKNAEEDRTMDGSALTHTGIWRGNSVVLGPFCKFGTV
ncbi:hypothetical protein predicted by Glimmer/Critica [Acetobacter ghanensis]|uniref:Uncharacterized protein n=1 Tax=Acetobacter ghanensis TaxID=431306 RepID=A0A0U5F340_9PROT|nr:hypothetical protein AA18895_2057 [Acetobacter ghanensis DSM 18895]CEF55659.1 hypothetical protein predicted by Glimmer/Critica [Acetobacter ghanensis]